MIMFVIIISSLKDVSRTCDELESDGELDDWLA